MTSVPASADSDPDRRWLILGVIGLAQLMVILDRVRRDRRGGRRGGAAAGRCAAEYLSWMLTASAGMTWLAQLGLHTGYAAGVLGPLILAGIGLDLIIAPAINTGTFGVAPQDAGVASAIVGGVLFRRWPLGQQRTSSPRAGRPLLDGKRLRRSTLT